MPQPFWGTLQGCLLLSESCDTGKTLCASGPLLCQAWEAGDGCAGSLISVKGRFGEGNDGQWFKKRLSSPLGVHQGGSVLLMEEHGPHMCCYTLPGLCDTHHTGAQVIQLHGHNNPDSLCTSQSFPVVTSGEAEQCRCRLIVVSRVPVKQEFQ